MHDKHEYDKQLSLFLNYMEKPIVLPTYLLIFANSK
jgi:hypothetical protein